MQLLWTKTPAGPDDGTRGAKPCVGVDDIACPGGMVLAKPPRLGPDAGKEAWADVDVGADENAWLGATPALKPPGHEVGIPRAGCCLGLAIHAGEGEGGEVIFPPIVKHPSDDHANGGPAAPWVGACAKAGLPAIKEGAEMSTFPPRPVRNAAELLDAELFIIRAGL